MLWIGSIYLNKQNEKNKALFTRKRGRNITRTHATFQQWKDPQNNQSIFNNVYKENIPRKIPARST